MVLTNKLTTDLNSTNMVALLIIVLNDIAGGGFSYGQAHSLPGNPMAFHKILTILKDVPKIQKDLQGSNGFAGISSSSSSVGFI